VAAQQTDAQLGKWKEDGADRVGRLIPSFFFPPSADRERSRACQLLDGVWGPGRETDGDVLLLLPFFFFLPVSFGAAGHQVRLGRNPKLLPLSFQPPVPRLGK